MFVANTTQSNLQFHINWFHRGISMYVLFLACSQSQCCPWIKSMLIWTNTKCLYHRCDWFRNISCSSQHVVQDLKAAFISLCTQQWSWSEYTCKPWPFSCSDTLVLLGGLVTANPVWTLSMAALELCPLPAFPELSHVCPDWECVRTLFGVILFVFVETNFFVVTRHDLCRHVSMCC